MSLLISPISICFATVPGPAELEDCFIQDFTDLGSTWYTAPNGFSVWFDASTSRISINGAWYDMHNIQCSWDDMPETALMNFSITYGGVEYPAQLEDVLYGGTYLYYY